MKTQEGFLENKKQIFFIESPIPIYIESTGNITHIDFEIHAFVDVDGFSCAEFKNVQPLFWDSKKSQWHSVKITDLAQDYHNSDFNCIFQTLENFEKYYLYDWMQEQINLQDEARKESRWKTGIEERNW